MPEPTVVTPAVAIVGGGPAGLSVADVRPVRDEIEARVLNLLAELGVPARP